MARKTNNKPNGKKSGVKVHTEQAAAGGTPAMEPVQFRMAMPFGIPDLSFGLANIFGAAPSIPAVPRTDIMDNGDSFTVNVDLPGVREEDVDLSISPQAIKVTARKSSEGEAKGKGYYFRESSASGYQRLTWLPQPIDPKSAKADMESGVLRIWAKKSN